MSHVPPPAGAMSGMYSRLRTSLSSIEPGQWAWMSLFLTIGVVFFLWKNVYVAGMSLEKSVLFLIPLVPIKAVSGYIFAPVRDKLLTYVKNKYPRWVVKCFVYAVDMTVGWTIIAVFCVDPELFPRAMTFTFGSSFVIYTPVEYAQKWLQEKFEGAGAFFPFFRKP